LNAISLPTDAGNHDPLQQLQALDTALNQVRSEIDGTLAQAKKHKNADEEAIFAAHLALLEDPALLDAAQQSIERGSAATHAWSQSIDVQCEVLQHTGSALLAERANDLRDLKQRVLRALLADTVGSAATQRAGCRRVVHGRGWRDFACGDSGARQRAAVHGGAGFGIA